MNSGPSAALLRAAQARPPAPVHPDRLQSLRAQASQARALEQEKANLEERLKATNKALNELYFKTLPDAMDEAGVTSIALPAEGNNPPVELKAQPFYAANIAAGWPDERRNNAFAWLDANGAGDLIKTELTLRFPRGELPSAQKLAAWLRQEHGLEPEIKQAVPHTSLTAWLRETVEQNATLPPLETLGATVGRVVKLKQKEND